MNNGGAGMAGPIWRNLMGQAIGSSAPRFAQPSGVVKATVCTNLGVRTDVFLSTNVPKKCTAPKVEKPKDKPVKEEKKPACAVSGKENLTADDPGCVADMCEIEGLENLAANDPNCVESDNDAGTDTDGDGVPDAVDACPDTPAGTEVTTTGCPVTAQIDTKAPIASTRRQGVFAV